jgi:hypothetical protein
MGSNARLVGQYIAFMVVAGVIGCYGVVDRNPILIVGAMASALICCRSRH